MARTSALATPLGYVFSLLLLLGWTQVQAAPLKQATVQAYMATLPDVRSLSNKLEASGAGDNFMEKMKPRPGQPFQPHWNGVQLLKSKHADYYQQLTSIVTREGFASATRWAHLGDQIVMTYIALKLDHLDPKLRMILNLPQKQQAQMLQFMSAHDREYLQQLQSVVQNASTVDANDKRVVAPFEKRLDQIYGSR